MGGAREQEGLRVFVSSSLARQAWQRSRMQKCRGAVISAGGGLLECDMWSLPREWAWVGVCWGCR